MMFSRYLFLSISLMTSFREFRVSGCVYNCTDKPAFTPSRLVVKYGDPARATCVVCQRNCSGTVFGLEKAVGEKTENGTTLLWTVDSMTEWDIDITCYYNSDDDQCCSTLDLTVYQPPESASISFVNHTGPMFENQQYTLQCSVQDVAPVQNLTVTFYRGHTALGQLQSKIKQQKPVNETFTLNITPSKEDDGAQYWCEAKLELGPDGPRLPPVETSEKLTATVYYAPELKRPENPALITITEGDTLHLNCSSVGNPSPSYTWTLPSDHSSSHDDNFTIESVGFEHEGQYICTVSNTAGNVTKEFKVHVQANPIIWIIIGASVALLVFIVVFTLCFHWYKQNRKGSYNLKDVFRFPSKHTALPLVQSNCDKA